MDIKEVNTIRERLINGNKKYASSLFSTLETGEALRDYLVENGQSPYAVVLACSDSRVNVEAAFSAGLGELFVVRSAGNVVLEGELASIAYAVNHLHCPYVLVLGHTHCGAVHSAIEGVQEEALEPLLHPIKDAIGNEKDAREGERLNVLKTVSLLKDIFKEGVFIEGAIYETGSGFVRFL